jgi:hypothetical protein
MQQTINDDTSDDKNEVLDRMLIFAPPNPLGQRWKRLCFPRLRAFKNSINDRHHPLPALFLLAQLFATGFGKRITANHEEKDRP